MAHKLKLPASIVGPAQVARLCRDLESFSEEMLQDELRKRASDISAGGQLQALAKLNDLDLKKADHRRELLEQLNTLLNTAPTVTMSFAVDPSAAFMAKMAEWFRQSIHPHVLIRIGLQPNIAAGFTLRTPSKVYDFSLRGKFADQRSALIKRLTQPTVAESGIKAPIVEAAK